MKITTVAHTSIVRIPDSLKGTPFTERSDWDTLEKTTDIDLLAELAGRGCYKSWTLPNPKTAENEGYLENILDVGHYSVLEHGTVTFYVEDVSRALLLELERHRHESFSVESQRFVDTSKHHPEAVVPPAFEGHPNLEHLLQQHYRDSLDKYNATFIYLRDTGLPMKQAREAARAFLLESTPVDFFVSANIRAWRDMLGKRLDTSADAEIQEFARLILSGLNAVAPNSVQDFTA